MSQEWRLDAACIGMDPDIFFCKPNGYNVGGKRGGGHTGWDQARSVCATCPVHWACRRDALEVERDAGTTWRYSMRGGLTPRERKEIAGWSEIDRRWVELQLEHDRAELHRTEWAVPA